MSERKRASHSSSESKGVKVSRPSQEFSKISYPLDESNIPLHNFGGNPCWNETSSSKFLESLVNKTELLKEEEKIEENEIFQELFESQPPLPPSPTSEIQPPLPSEEYSDGEIITEDEDNEEVKENREEDDESLNIILDSSPYYSSPDDLEELDELINASVINERKNSASKKQDGENNEDENDEDEDDAIPHEERIKIVLDDVDSSRRNFFDVLPDGWIQIVHSSGMPLYLHRTSRVVSVSRPYFIGSGNVKKHSVPIPSIPCLHYKRSLVEEEEARAKYEAEKLENPTKRPRFPKAKVSTVEEVALKESLTPEQFRDFCKSVFRFKEIKIRKFRNWSERRKFQKQENKNNIKAAIYNSSLDAESGCKKFGIERPTLPEGTKVLSVPVIELEPITGDVGDGSALHQRIVKKSRKEWVINPVGKSMVCILHEYIQQCLKTQPTYKFCEMESSTTPYGATVLISGMEYGKGFGSSKRSAKNEAAKLTLEILIPEMKDKFTNSGNELAPDVTFFDDIRIEDPRVSELCNRTSEPSPYAILLTCLQRNYGLGDTNISTELKQMRNKRNEFTMRVAKREVNVICKNKRDGKQFASQTLLQNLHPHIKSWGSLLRLYGNRAIRLQKAKKAKESEVTELQSRSSLDVTPSFAILEKLREEMRKLSGDKSNYTIGKFVVPFSNLNGTTSGLVTKIDI